MGHHLEAFVGRPELLRTLAPRIAGLRLLALPQGLALAPIPEELRPVDDDDPGGPAGTLALTAALAEIAAAASHAGPIGWIETDWFGGMGENRGVLWHLGRVQDLGDVNPVLRALGVARKHAATDSPLIKLARAIQPPPPLDEWDSVGLGDWRSTDRAYERATPVE